MGGRLSAPVDPDPSHRDVAPEDEGYRVKWHWTEQSIRTLDELERWEEFRKYQQRTRRNVEAFDKYQSFIVSCRERRQIQYDPTLLLELEQQSKVDEWKEYCIFYLNKIDKKERLLEKLHERKAQVESSNWEEEELKAYKAEKTQRDFAERVKKQVQYIEANGTADVHGDGQDTQTEYEANRWKAFREHQQAKRTSPEEFKKYKADLRGHHRRNLNNRYYQRRHWGLKLDSTRQSKLDEWIEFLHFEQREEFRLRCISVPTPSAVESGIKDAERRIKELQGLLESIQSQLPAIEAEAAAAKQDVPRRQGRRSHKRTVGGPTRSSARIASKSLACPDRVHSAPRKSSRPAASSPSTPKHASKVSKPARKNRRSPRRQQSVNRPGASQPADSSIQAAACMAPVPPDVPDKGERRRNPSPKSHLLGPSRSSGVSKQRTRKPAYLPQATSRSPPKECPTGHAGTLRRSARIRDRLDREAFMNLLNSQTAP